ncbi:hypothetical protein J6590_081996 [Homalodisca vitripennis]|nr:hypothetical protein J6590_081996 [Homalodisca vitripennis]
MCDCDSWSRELYSGLTSCAVTTPGLDPKQLLVLKNYRIFLCGFLNDTSLARPQIQELTIEDWQVQWRQDT